jgi:hypothetical protein
MNAKSTTEDRLHVSISILNTYPAIMLAPECKWTKGNLNDSLYPVMERLMD